MSTMWDPMWSDAVADVNQLLGLSPLAVRRARGPRYWPAAAAEAPKGFHPDVDVFEDEKSFSLTFDLPGFKAEDVHVEVEEKLLKVHGERSLPQEDREGYRCLERAYGAFERRFRLPENVDADALDAKLESGVLVLRLPKRELPGVRRIEIASA